jgi:murein DD-endopeptidase MepM/ murein hydrolase activator NlpD
MRPPSPFFGHRNVPTLPRTSTRARTVAASAALVLLGAVAVVPHAAADENLHKKQRQVQGQVRSAQGQLEESSQALTAAAKKLRSAQAALVAAQRRLTAAQTQADAAALQDAQMQARLQVAEHNLALARVALDTAKKRVVEQRAAIGRLAASNYANGDPALMGLVVILNSQDPAEATSQMNTVDSLMNKQTTLLTELRQARARLVSEEAKVEKAKTLVATQRKAAAENLVMKESLERAAAGVRAEVATLVVQSRAAQAQAAQARRADLVQLWAAKKQEQRIKQLIIERARRQHGGFKGDAGGFLYRPVPGYVTSPYGWRRHPIYGYWGLHDGTDFHAPCGTPERAAASGTVISKVWSDVYGNRLYLDLGQVNGKNMTVIYNHLSSYRVKAGAHVKRGEVVGFAGTTGWSTACHLHFTVLLDGNPVDPMGYM